MSTRLPLFAAIALLTLLGLLVWACSPVVTDGMVGAEDDNPIDDDDVVTDDDDAVDDDDVVDDDDATQDDDDATQDDDDSALPVFESFRMITSYGPCPEETDCDGFIQVDADGLLTIDIEGELPSQIHESKVPLTDLEAALPALTDPVLVELLADDALPCMKVDDVYELMTLTQSGQEMSNETTMCDTEVIVSARETITGLATAFGP